MTAAARTARPSPRKNAGPQHAGAEGDSERLLNEERFTIEGAKKYIREVGLERVLGAKPGAAAAHLEVSGAAHAPGAASASDTGADRARRTLAEVRREMTEVRRELESLHK